MYGLLLPSLDLVKKASFPSSQSVNFVTSSSNHIANIKIKQKCIKSDENNYKVNQNNDELSKTLMNYINLLNQTY